MKGIEGEKKEYAHLEKSSVVAKEPPIHGLWLAEITQAVTRHF